MLFNLPGHRPDPEEGEREPPRESRKVQQLPEQLVRALRTVQGLLDEVKPGPDRNKQSQKDTEEEEEEECTKEQTLNHHC